MTNSDDALDKATRRRAERDWLERQITAQQAELATAAGDLNAAKARLDAEDADVRRLERLGITRALAVIRGTRTGELSRERAEAELATLAFQRSCDHLQGLRSELDALNTRLADYADVDAEYDRAVRVRTAKLARLGRREVGEIDALSEQLESLPLQQVEVAEAITAGQAALLALVDAQRALSTAHNWSSMDTWLDGGFVTTAIKHSRMDAADVALSRVGRTMAAFRAELADVATTLPVRMIEVSPTMRGFDLWFDNFFTDYTVHRRIGQARDTVNRSVGEVRAAVSSLEQMAADLATSRHALRYERDQVLARASRSSAATSSSTDSSAS